MRRTVIALSLAAAFFLSGSRGPALGEDPVAAPKDSAPSRPDGGLPPQTQPAEPAIRFVHHVGSGDNRTVACVSADDLKWEEGSYDFLDCRAHTTSRLLDYPEARYRLSMYLRCTVPIRKVNLAQMVRETPAEAAGSPAVRKRLMDPRNILRAHAFTKRDFERRLCQGEYYSNLAVDDSQGPEPLPSPVPDNWMMIYDINSGRFGYAVELVGSTENELREMAQMTIRVWTYWSKKNADAALREEINATRQRLPQLEAELADKKKQLEDLQKEGGARWQPREHLLSRLQETDKALALVDGDIAAAKARLAGVDAAGKQAGKDASPSTKDLLDSIRVTAQVDLAGLQARREQGRALLLQYAAALRHREESDTRIELLPNEIAVWEGNVAWARRWILLMEMQSRVSFGMESDPTAVISPIRRPGQPRPPVKEDDPKPEESHSGLFE